MHANCILLNQSHQRKTRLGKDTEFLYYPICYSFTMLKIKVAQYTTQELLPPNPSYLYFKEHNKEYGIFVHYSFKNIFYSMCF